VSEAFDAVIVGAGPAGSAAAITLGRAGWRVLLLDRHEFPRDKVCGDLIGARAIAAAARLGLPHEALDRFGRIRGAVVTANCSPLELNPSSAMGRRFLAGTDARVVPRVVFDDLLARVAAGVGARRWRATVRDVSSWHGGRRFVRAMTSSGEAEFAARTVVIAGGYGCRVAPDVAPRERDDGPSRGIARRGYFRGVSSPSDRIVFALERWLLPGYGWIFPLPEGGANVGVGTLVADDDPASTRLDDLWYRFTRDHRSPAAEWLRGATPDGPPRTWPLDLGPRRRCLVADGLLVVGEAAGLVGPLTGAGIAFALESGQCAGDVIADALTAGDTSRRQLDRYGRQMRRRTAPWLRAELLAQRFLTDPARADRFFETIRPLPMTPALGARLLLQLG
jgi:geranylgeranyl reductase family protein